MHVTKCSANKTNPSLPPVAPPSSASLLSPSHLPTGSFRRPCCHARLWHLRPRPGLRRVWRCRPSCRQRRPGLRLHQQRIRRCCHASLHRVWRSSCCSRFCWALWGWGRGVWGACQHAGPRGRLWRLPNHLHIWSSWWRVWSGAWGLSELSLSCSLASASGARTAVYSSACSPLPDPAACALAAFCHTPPLPLAAPLHPPPLALPSCCRRVPLRWALVAPPTRAHRRRRPMRRGRRAAFTTTASAPCRRTR
jgi:hypothetical protein